MAFADILASILGVQNDPLRWQALAQGFSDPRIMPGTQFSAASGLYQRMQAEQAEQERKRAIEEMELQAWRQEQERKSERFLMEKEDYAAREEKRLADIQLQEAQQKISEAQAAAKMGGVDPYVIQQGMGAGMGFSDILANAAQADELAKVEAQRAALGGLGLNPDLPGGILNSQYQDQLTSARDAARRRQEEIDAITGSTSSYYDTEGEVHKVPFGAQQYIQEFVNDKGELIPGWQRAVVQYNTDRLNNLMPGSDVRDRGPKVAVETVAVGNLARWFQGLTKHEKNRTQNLANWLKQEGFDREKALRVLTQEDFSQMQIAWILRELEKE